MAAGGGCLGGVRVLIRRFLFRKVCGTRGKIVETFSAKGTRRSAQNERRVAEGIGGGVKEERVGGEGSSFRRRPARLRDRSLGRSRSYAAPPSGAFWTRLWKSLYHRNPPDSQIGPLSFEYPYRQLFPQLSEYPRTLQKKRRRASLHPHPPCISHHRPSPPA